MKPTILCLLLSSVMMQAADPGVLLDALRAELQTLSAPSEDKAVKANEVDRVRLQLMQEHLPSSDKLKPELLVQTQQSVEQIRMVSPSAKVTEICSTLVLVLQDKIKEQNVQKQEALKARLESTLRSALETGLKALTAKELDGPLQELAQLQKELTSSNYRSDAKVKLNVDALSVVEPILTAIQDAMLGVGNSTDRRYRDSSSRLSGLLTYSRQLSDLMPRSEYLEKVQAVIARLSPEQNPKVMPRQELEKKIQDIFVGVKKLEELGEALGKMDDLISQQSDHIGSRADSNFLGQLRALRNTFEEFRAGSATSMSFTTTSSFSGGISTGALSLSPLKNLLVKFALPRVLRTSGDRVPKEDEDVPTYLQRMLETARSTSDWPLLARVLDAADSMNLNNVANSEDSTALHLFLAGLNQERARQYSGAVACHLAALRTGSQVVPVEKIGDILDALKKDHPEEYEAGVKLADSPMAMKMTTSSYRNEIGYPSDFGQRKAPQMQRYGSTLVIPAVEDAEPEAMAKSKGKETAGKPVKESPKAQ